MEARKQEPSLIAVIADEMGCCYLSDLRCTYLGSQTLYLTVEAIPAERFPAAEWHKALAYLSGLWVEDSLTAGEAKARLLGYLAAGREWRTASGPERAGSAGGGAGCCGPSRY